MLHFSNISTNSLTRSYKYLTVKIMENRDISWATTECGNVNRGDIIRLLTDSRKDSARLKVFHFQKSRKDNIW
jgi:hypothetical protein